MKSAVLFLVFNRPDKTQQVFEAIMKAKPPRLYVVADGPREDAQGDPEKCSNVRRIATSVSWDCEVKTLFHEDNKGCDISVKMGVDWFFENESDGIILEDDCLPSQSFFLFCDEMLEFYRDDSRVMAVCGTNILNKWDDADSDYIFSYYGGNWGWATWKRAWEKNYCSVDLYRIDYDKKCIQNVLGEKQQAKALYEWFGDMGDKWDVRWLYARLSNSGLTIVPSRNLIKNIGYGLDATHTKSASWMHSLTLYELRNLHRFNPRVVVDRDFDKRNAMMYGFLGFGYWKKTLCSLLRKILNQLK